MSVSFGIERHAEKQKSEIRRRLPRGLDGGLVRTGSLPPGDSGLRGDLHVYFKVGGVGVRRLCASRMRSCVVEDWGK